MHEPALCTPSTVSRGVKLALLVLIVRRKLLLSMEKLARRAGKAALRGREVLAYTSRLGGLWSFCHVGGVDDIVRQRSRCSAIPKRSQ